MGVDLSQYYCPSMINNRSNLFARWFDKRSNAWPDYVQSVAQYRFHWTPSYLPNNYSLRLAGGTSYHAEFHLWQAIVRANAIIFFTENQSTMNILLSNTDLAGIHDRPAGRSQVGPRPDFRQPWYTLLYLALAERILL